VLPLKRRRFVSEPEVARLLRGDVGFASTCFLEDGAMSCVEIHRSFGRSGSGGEATQDCPYED